MRIIKNYNQLATSKARKNVLNIIEAGIKKVHPHNLIEIAIQYNETFNSVTVQNNTYDIIKGRIFVIGGGKASGFMAEKLEEIIGAKNITVGVVNCTKDDYQTEKIKIIKASHPLPDKKGVKGVEKMLELKNKYKINKKDLVICLISGGGSALMPCPVEGIKLKDKQLTTQLLLESGADIREINIVRKHLSKAKGGQLAVHFAPAQVVSVIISDVVENNMDVIASGATVADPTTFRDAYAVLSKHGLLEKIPQSIRRYIEQGVHGKAEETPKEVSNCNNYIIGDAATAMETMALEAKKIGLKPLIASCELVGETETVAIEKARDIASGDYESFDLVLFGGETTPKLPANYGRGGRNQHYIAVSMFALRDMSRTWAMASIATDGIDYLPGVAGAIIDDNSLSRSREIGQKTEDLIKNYATNNLFTQLGDSLINTDETGTNVGDIVVYYLKK
ncbi:MAG: DUF4147 domain-containing protein [Patescibacteria group bacterium]|nr:DUF4147 domain-containing protein [Patescibacteria group bacterium]